LVLKTVDLQTIAADDITQIDQNDEGVSFSSVTVGTLADGTYEVRIGGDGTVQTATFTVGESGGETEGTPIIVGDANLDGAIETSDAGYVLRAANKQTSRIGRVGTTLTKADGSGSVIVGDANLDGAIETSDAGYVLRAANKQTTRIGKVNETVQVVSAE
jgi:hypothetical protein